MLVFHPGGFFIPFLAVFHLSFAIQKSTTLKGPTVKRSNSMAQADIREYETQAASTAVFGRVVCSARNHHFIVDGPIQNGCPGEELTPAEIFLAGVAACGVELVQVLAKSANIRLQGIAVKIRGTMDRSKPVRSDVTLFNCVRLEFRMNGINHQEAKQLVEKFKGR
jgi:uncharacterized OsmC-like protein